MKIINIKSRREFDITKDEWNVIIGNGNSYKYQVVEDDTPLEIKSLRELKTQLPTSKKKTTK